MADSQRQELARFRQHVRQLEHRSFPENRDGFDEELSRLQQVDERVRSNVDEFHTASLGSSMAKNRFNDVKPNEGTMVVLKPMTARGDGMYINANYIDARKPLGVPFVYIATQAPMSNTVLDFWRMVVENDAAFVVMLCADKEHGKVKSEVYWPPPNEVLDLGVLSVTTLNENRRAESMYRTLRVRTARGDKEVYHMQYLAWPDQDVPQSSTTLMEMIREIAKSPRSTTSPIVVHCSGGVGRTGVFIGMHVALAQFDEGVSGISVPRIVAFMKQCRSGMVQRKDQYLFLYYAVMREMERIVLSEETGYDLLDVRPRERMRKPVQRTRPSPLVGVGIAPIPMPTQHSPWTIGTLVPKLFGKRAANEKPVGPAVKDPSANRDTVDDAVIMEDYLMRYASPSAARPEPMLPATSSVEGQSNSGNVASPPIPLRAPSVAEGRSSAPQQRVSPQVSLASSPSLGYPIHHVPTTTLEEQLLEAQRANRMKRASPNVSLHYDGWRSTSPSIAPLTPLHNGHLGGRGSSIHSLVGSLHDVARGESQPDSAFGRSRVSPTSMPSRSLSEAGPFAASPTALRSSHSAVYDVPLLHCSVTREELAQL